MHLDLVPVGIKIFLKVILIQSFITKECYVHFKFKIISLLEFTLYLLHVIL